MFQTLDPPSTALTEQGADETPRGPFTDDDRLGVLRQQLLHPLMNSRPSESPDGRDVAAGTLLQRPELKSERLRSAENE